MEDRGEPQPGAGRTIGVFGTGVMAHGIARLCLQHGYDVVVLSSSPPRAEGLRARLTREVEHHEGAGTASCEEATLGRATILVEATVEELEAKWRALRAVEAALPDDAILATTTSSLSVTALASELVRPDRALGLHFFNPVHRMKLVEVVAGVRTAPWALERGRAFAQGIGKHPLTVPDRAGFIVNRLMITYLNGAARLVESGAASVEDVDTAMTLGTAHPLGPFALIDLIGADVVAAIDRSVHQETKDPVDAPSPGLLRQVSAGRLGRKTGRGYHTYPKRGSRGGRA
jgi:3-hydroxybutyryl-CoA dehydrogenase